MPGDHTASSELRGTLEHVPLIVAGWRVFRSDAGRWWATRTGAGRRKPFRAGSRWSMTLDADTPDELANAIRAQDDPSPLAP